MPCKAVPAKKISRQENPDLESMERPTASELKKNNRKDATVHASKMILRTLGSESQRIRAKDNRDRKHQGRIDEKGHDSMTHYSLVRETFSNSQSNEDPCSKKAAVDKEWEQLQKFPAWEEAGVKSKSEVARQVRKEGKQPHFATLMHFMSSHKQRGQEVQKNKGRGVLRGGICSCRS